MKKALVMLRAMWLRWQRVSVNRQVMAASITLMVLAVICKLAAAGKEIVTAYCFGTGDAVDAFVMAFSIPSFAIMVVANALGTAMLPTLTRVRQGQGQPAARQLLQDATSWCLVLLLISTALLMASSVWIFRVLCPDYDESKQALARGLLLLLCPTVVFHGLAAVWGSVLHSHERFVATGLVPIVTPIAAMVCMLWGAKVWGIYALAFGIMLGSIAEAAAIGWTLVRRGYRLWPSVAGVSPELRQVLHQYWPLIAAALLMGSTTLVDNAMASWLGSGSVATLSYGRKLVGLALTIPALSLSKAVFPYFAKMAAQDDWNQINHTLATYRRAVLFSTIPLAIIMLVFSRPLTSLVLERGAFDATSTTQVAWVQAMYALQIPFYTLGILYVRLASSLRMNHLLTISTVISILVNAGMNYVLMQYLDVAGIALSTSIVYLISCCFLVLMVSKVMHQESRQ
jgi:putative peptidoglycan lipid II flippase